MKYTALSSGTSFSCMCFLFMCSLVPLIKERTVPSHSIYIEQGFGVNMADINTILKLSRNEAYVKFLSQKTAALMFLPRTAVVDFKYIANAFADKKAYFALAKTVYNVPVGFILTRQLTDKALFIDFLFVLPEFQNKKVGRNLISHSFFHAKEKYPATSIIEVETHKDHPQALNFYLKQGFHVVKEYLELDYIVCVLLKHV